MEEIHLALGKLPDVVVFRNHVGAGRVERDDGSAQFQTWGLHPGSSDLVCIVAPYGRWLCIEVKSPTGRETAQQHAFRSLMARFGSVCGIARSVSDALALVGRARQPMVAPGRTAAEWLAGT